MGRLGGEFVQRFPLGRRWYEVAHALGLSLVARRFDWLTSWRAPPRSRRFTHGSSRLLALSLPLPLARLRVSMGLFSFVCVPRFACS